MPECEHFEVCGLQSKRKWGDTCILHAEAEDKSVDRFRRAFERHLDAGSTDFRYMHFPDEFTFPNEIAGDRIRFEDATFLGNVVFATTFRGPVSFKKAGFRARARFGRTQFLGEATFDGAEFSEKLNLREAYVDEDFSFMQGWVAGEADFSHLEADGDVFIGSTFTEPVSLQNAQFNEKVSLSGSTFEDHVDAKDLTCEKEFEAINTEFQGDADFTEGEIGGRADFENVAFGKRVLFASTEFHDGAHFNSATFEGETKFPNRTFWSIANFGAATFCDALLFRQVYSDGQVHFGRAEFHSETDFSLSFLNDEDPICEKVLFSGAVFRGDLTFGGHHRKLKTFDGAHVNFRGVTFEDGAVAHFRNADLSRCEFRSTDMSRIDFTEVTWCEQVADKEWFARVGLFDEVKIKAKEGQEYGPSWSAVEKLYRQLKQAYQERGDYPRAGDFHIGEKEMRRRNPSTRRGMRGLLRLYKNVSKYGERALPALGWLAGLVLVSTAVYIVTGVETAVGNDPLSPGSLSDWWAGFLLSTKITVLFGTTTSFSDLGAESMRVLQAIFSPPLLALLALALRQRVKR